MHYSILWMIPCGPDDEQFNSLITFVAHFQNKYLSWDPFTSVGHKLYNGLLRIWNSVIVGGLGSSVVPIDPKKYLFIAFLAHYFGHCCFNMGQKNRFFRKKNQKFREICPKLGKTRSIGCFWSLLVLFWLKIVKNHWKSTKKSHFWPKNTIFSKNFGAFCAKKCCFNVWLRPPLVRGPLQSHILLLHFISSRTIHPNIIREQRSSLAL